LHRWNVYITYKLTAIIIHKTKEAKMQTVLKPPLNTTQKSKTITTSLYELIETVQREIGSENDELVVATVMYVLGSRRAKFLNSMEVNHCN